jgi:3-hydroxyacyl-[acyl-carrier-protein] dehydratase
VYTARLERIQPDGALVRGTSHLGEKLQANIDLYFAYFDNRNVQRGQFIPGDFMRMLRIFKLFDVGVDAEGQPLKIPAAMLESERNLIS